MVDGESLSAFLAQSFAKADDEVNRAIRDFLKSAGVDSETGEEAENRRVSEKVRDRIARHPLFVGILTRRSPIEPHDADLPYFFSRAFQLRQPTRFTTSEWVIQESGYALGVDRRVILVVEPGVEFPELQGDLEYVPLYRSSMDRTFQRLNEVIGSIRGLQVFQAERPSAGAVSQEPGQPLPQQDQTPPALPKDMATPAESQRIEALQSLFQAFFGDRDLSKAEAAFKTVVPLLDPRELARWEGFYQRQRYLLGDMSAFDELERLAERNSEDGHVQDQLGLAFETLKAWPKAAKQFSRASELSTDPLRRAKLDAKAASCMVEEGDSANALSLLKSRLGSEGMPAARAALLKALAAGTETSGDVESAMLLRELALDEDPSDNTLRFEVAYTYQKRGNPALGIYHYRILEATEGSGVTLNNLGVGLYELGLVGRGVEAYRKASARKETLAMANLADKYRGAGFLDDATAMIREALNATPIEAVHGNVGRAKEALHTQRESEAAKEQEILEQAERTREFRIRAAQAFLSPVGDSFDLTGSWDWKEWVPMHVVHSGTDVTGRYEKSTTTSWPSLSAFGGDVKTVQTKSVVLEGVLRGRTIRFSLKETLKSEYGSPETNTGTVEAIFAASGDTGSVREELSDKTTRYYTVRRIDS